MIKSVTQMRLSGGHPVLDFVNTIDSRRGRIGPDLLETPGNLVAFARRVGMIDDECEMKLSSQSRSPDASAMQSVKNLREAFYRLFLSEDRGGEPAQGDVALVQNVDRIGRSKRCLVKDAVGWSWYFPVEEFADLLALFAMSGTDLLVERGARRSVRECKGDNCGWLFIDHSKAGRRRWCSDASCGVHSRVKRFRSEKIKS
jgi:predicted RNA-binding Zn ribbon-like protein